MIRMVKLREASEETGLSYYYLRKACLEGKIAHIRAGNKFMINMDWLENNINEIGKVSDEEERILKTV